MCLAGCAPASHSVRVNPPAKPPRRTRAVTVAGLPATLPGPLPILVPATPPAVDVLIAQVERDLHLGEQQYQAGHFGAAEDHFDSAIHRLMTSGLNYSDDPRLEPLMDRLINTMHRYQMKTEQVAINVAGGNQAEQQENPAEPSSPLEEIAEAANFPSDPEIAQKAASELLHVPHDLPLTINQPVLTYLSFFESPRGRAIIEHSLARAGRYESMVRRVLKEEGLPQDLMYLPLPESGYHARAVSRVGARGLWQFMPETGRRYGLKINRWEDERMDPVASTRAAAEHLRDLYDMFHDWYLALAAYDSGSLTVARAVERTGYADFWQLYRLNAFPFAETKNYVPIMLAMTMVAKDPKLYGVDITDPEKPIPTDSFKPGRSLDLRLAADAIGVDVKLLRTLNPELFGLITPNDPTFTLYIPAGTENKLEATLDKIPGTHWVGWRLHNVTGDETLASIARHYHVTAAALASANSLSPSDPVTEGQTLLVPAPVLPLAIFYRVRSGDTVGGIAHRYRVSIGELRLWNHLRSNLIRIGQVLRIYTRESGEGYAAESYGRSRTRYHRETAGGGYIVRWGDSLWSIARRYGVSVDALRAANPRAARAGLKPGQRLTIPRR